MLHLTFLLRAGLLGAACLLVLPVVAKEQYTISASVEVEAYSDIGPIKQLLDDLEGPALDDGNFAFTHNQAELSYKEGRFELSLFARYDYYLRFNRDTVDLAYQYKNDLPLDEGRVYQLYLDAKHIRANGVGYSYYFSPAAKWSSKVRLNLLRALEVKEGGMQGFLVSREDDYDADIGLDYIYSEDTLLKRPPESVRAHGYGFDIDVGYQPTARLGVALALRDVLTRLEWDDVTYTRARLTSNNVSFDENGTIQTRPALSGIESYRDETQRMPLRAALAADYQLSEKNAVNASLFSYDGRVFPRLGGSQQVGQFLVSADVDLRSRALAVGAELSGLSLMLRSDNTDWEKASHLAFSLAYHYRF